MKKCPNCEGELIAEENSVFKCSVCGKKFRIKTKNESEDSEFREKEQITSGVSLMETDSESEKPKEDASADNKEENPIRVLETESISEVGASDSKTEEEDESSIDIYKDNVENSFDGAGTESSASGEGQVSDLYTAEQTDVADSEEIIEATEFGAAKIRGKDIYGIVMRYLPAGLTLLLAILLFIFLACNVVQNAFIAFTGYDLISAKTIEIVKNGYGTSAFILAMAVVLLLAGIAQILLAVFDKSNKRVKYAFYVAQMCVSTCLFVASCTMISGANAVAHAGDCGIVTVVFSVLYLTALPFVYVLSVTKDMDSAKIYIKDYFERQKTRLSAIKAKIEDNQMQREKNSEGAAAYGSEGSPQFGVAADSAIFGGIPAAYQFAGNVGIPEGQTYASFENDENAFADKEDIPVGEVCENNEDGEEIISSEPDSGLDEADLIESFAPPSSLVPVTSAAYSEKYGLTLDDVIESIWVKGRYSVYRIMSAALLFITALGGLIAAGVGSIGIPYQAYASFGYEISMICNGAILAPIIALLITMIVSASKKEGRIPLIIFYIIIYVGSLAAILCGNIIGNSVTKTFTLLHKYLAFGVTAICSPVLFGLGMGRHYDKKVPLTRKQKIASGAVSGVLGGIVAIIAIAGIITEAVIPNPYAQMNRLELGMSQERIESTMSDSYRSSSHSLNSSGDEYTYYLGSADELKVTFDKYGDAVEISCNFGFYGSSSINSKSLERYESSYSFVNYAHNDGTKFYLKANLKYTDGSWRKTYVEPAILYMQYRTNSDTMEIWYTLPDNFPWLGNYNSEDSGNYYTETKSVREWKALGFSAIKEVYDNMYGESSQEYYTFAGASGSNSYFSWSNSNSSYPFTMSGNCLVSSNTGSGSSASFTLTARSYIIMSVEYKVSSESGYDFLTVYKNGSQYDRISGETSWKTVSFILNQNDYIQFMYSKDSSGSNGDDRAYIRVLKF